MYNPEMRVGVDTGGTFTDFVFWDGSRRRTHKVRSTPDDPARAILRGLGEATGVRELVHGSTVATNALLERRGADTVFITTAGFEDVLDIGRQARRSLYDWLDPGPKPLIPHGRRLGVQERVLHDGAVERALDAREVERVASWAKESGAKAAAVCLLHAYANPSHERALGEALRAAGLFVSLSHEVLPEYREYERASTTAVNAYVSPLMAGYLQRLEVDTPSHATVRVFQSNGGSMSARAASEAAVHTVLSGPAGGVQGGVAAARAAGFNRVITFDMGGTSTDVAVYDGAFGYTHEGELDGLPIRVSMLDIHTVGAGGGSIAYLDSGGALRVGPRSAGADPGPVCYGGGGTEPTVTDANVVLGRIDPATFLSGRMELDVEAAFRALDELGRKAGASREAAARAVVDVARSNMERAIRRITVERGIDPRELTLVAFGGAGPLHACELAQGLEIPTVLAPRDAGVLSAVGMLTADCVRDYSMSVGDQGADSAFAALEIAAAEEMAEDGFAEARLERSIDMRYRGQSYEITVPWERRGSFPEEHQRLYGYRHEGREIEAVTARVKAVAVADETAKLDLAAPSDEQSFATLFAPDGWADDNDAGGNRILTRKG